MITCIGDLVGFYTKQTEIVKNRLFELLLLLGRVRVVKTDDKLSLKGIMCKVVVEESGLRMTNVKIPTVMLDQMLS